MRFPLSALADVRLGYPFRTRVTPDPQGETALVQLADLNGGLLDTATLVRVHLAKIRTHFALRPGDILFRARSQLNDATYVADLTLSPGVTRVVAAAPIMVVRVVRLFISVPLLFVCVARSLPGPVLVFPAKCSSIRLFLPSGLCYNRVQ